MEILRCENWADYELIDSGSGFRLEKFGRYVLQRPDPQIIWPKTNESLWQKPNAVFIDSWQKKSALLNKWEIKFKDYRFFLKLSPFKHTGIFPEQTCHWLWLEELIKKENRPLRVLNLFAYTGTTSVVLARNNCQITHLDASYPTIAWAKENVSLNKVENKIRFILDDAIKFVIREKKRQSFYDGIIMDPPIYGHGPGGEKWKFQTNFPVLLNLCKQILTPNPLFILINAYAISASALMLENVLAAEMKNLGGKISCGELALAEKNSSRLLSTGIFSRWSKE